MVVFTYYAVNVTTLRADEQKTPDFGVLVNRLYERSVHLVTSLRYTLCCVSMKMSHLRFWSISGSGRICIKFWLSSN